MDDGDLDAITHSALILGRTVLVMCLVGVVLLWRIARFTRARAYGKGGGRK